MDRRFERGQNILGFRKPPRRRKIESHKTERNHTIRHVRFAQAGEGAATRIKRGLTLAPRHVVLGLLREDHADQPFVADAFRRRNRLIEVTGRAVVVRRVLCQDRQACLEPCTFSAASAERLPSPRINASRA
jgi:hypothetical protein